MKIHEKDPNSSPAAAPPSPLKRRRLSSKRKLSHDVESEKEDPAPAKKVLPAPPPHECACSPGATGRNPPSLKFLSLGTWQTPTPRLFSCVSLRCFIGYLEESVPARPCFVEPRLSPLLTQRACSVVRGCFCFSR